MHFEMSSAICFNLDQYKILSCGNGLKTEINFGMVEDIVGKGENAGYQPFSPFPAMFLKTFNSSVQKGRDCVIRRFKHGLTAHTKIFVYCEGL